MINIGFYQIISPKPLHRIEMLLVIISIGLIGNLYPSNNQSNEFCIRNKYGSKFSH